MVLSRFPKDQNASHYFIIIDLFLWNDEIGTKVVCLCIEGVKTYERAAYKTMICTGVNFPALPQNKRASNSVTLELSIEWKKFLQQGIHSTNGSWERSEQT